MNELVPFHSLPFSPGGVDSRSAWLLSMESHQHSSLYTSSDGELTFCKRMNSAVTWSLSLSPAPL